MEDGGCLRKEEEEREREKEGRTSRGKNCTEIVGPPSNLVESRAYRQSQPVLSSPLTEPIRELVLPTEIILDVSLTS